ncbi:MAG: hypothetical protein J6L87_02930 [Clostridia bacterium]|nr:hypothetical protein [Clostridia bacterium]
MKILFVGNSHTYFHDMPATVLQLLEATGVKSHVAMITAGGKNLVYHTKRHDVAFNIAYGGYDFVVLQDQAVGFSPAAFFERAAKLKEMADKAGVPVCLYMPWAHRDHREAQPRMTEAYERFCRANDCPLAPAGEVMSRLLLTEATDTLYHSDGNHASPIGSYAAAVTVFYAITGRRRILDPEKIADPGIAAGIPAALCAKIHTEACRTTRIFNG